VKAELQLCMKKMIEQKKKAAEETQQKAREKAN
jgi:hypothetical protein